jgi:hypothetical protein
MTKDASKQPATRRRANRPQNSLAERGAVLDASSVQGDPAVVAFLQKLEHRLKPELEAIRRIILDADPEIREGIKWNAPSFRTTDWFATLNLRSKNGTERVWLILHTGAKVKAAATGVKIADPTGLLEWLAKDRAVVMFVDANDVKAKRRPLGCVIQEWIRQV